MWVTVGAESVLRLQEVPSPLSKFAHESRSIIPCHRLTRKMPSSGGEPQLMASAHNN